MAAYRSVGRSQTFPAKQIHRPVQTASMMLYGRSSAANIAVAQLLVVGEEGSSPLVEAMLVVEEVGRIEHFQPERAV